MAIPLISVLYWLLDLQTELALYLYLLCHTGTLALRVHTLRPGHAYIIPLFAVCVSLVHLVVSLSTPRLRRTPPVGGVQSRRMHIGGAA